MKRVTPVPEPANFDTRCRKRGQKWLRENPNYIRPKDYWSEFESQLRAAFADLCGYCAMVTMKSHVDHFIPVAVLKVHNQHDQAYEWSNFRYGEGVFNQRKSNHIVLDPFRVKDDWFEIQLPSLQLVLTAAVPKKWQKLAEFTIERLGLRDNEVVIRYRQIWFEMYRDGKLTIAGLRKVAPLVACAIERDVASGID